MKTTKMSEALQKVRASMAELLAVWSEDQIESYPSNLPSFDDLTFAVDAIKLKEPRANVTIHGIDVPALANKLSDAYSTHRYKGGWSSSIKMLQRRGYDARQIEAIIRSKWTRWAADHANTSHATSADLARWMDSLNNLEVQVAEIVAETFNRDALDQVRS